MRLICMLFEMYYRHKSFAKITSTFKLWSELRNNRIGAEEHFDVLIYTNEIL